MRARLKSEKRRLECLKSSSEVMPVQSVNAGLEVGEVPLEVKVNTNDTEVRSYLARASVCLSTASDEADGLILLLSAMNWPRDTPFSGSGPISLLICMHWHVSSFSSSR